MDRCMHPQASPTHQTKLFVLESVFVARLIQAETRRRRRIKQGITAIDLKLLPISIAL